MGKGVNTGVAQSGQSACLGRMKFVGSTPTIRTIYN